MEVIRLGLATCQDVPVNGAICWIEVDGLPWLGRLRVDGVPIAGPRQLAENLRKPGSVTAEGRARRAPPRLASSPFNQVRWGGEVLHVAQGLPGALRSPPRERRIR